MRLNELNLLSKEKSVSAGSLFHVLITRSQKKSGANYFGYLIS